MLRVPLRVRWLSWPVESVGGGVGAPKTWRDEAVVWRRAGEGDWRTAWGERRQRCTTTAARRQQPRCGANFQPHPWRLAETMGVHHIVGMRIHPLLSRFR
jgi:hypothetical protein